MSHHSTLSNILNSSEVVVVGNGHVSLLDRSVIKQLYTQKKSDVIRFSDMNSWIIGEPLTIHVTRYPGSFPPFARYTALHELYVTYTLSGIPSNVTSILVYEAYRGSSNDMQGDFRLFPKCVSCICEYNRTSLGPSTGGAVLSDLEMNANVQSIHVFGMNWMGTKDHVDFADPTIVPMCCTKCIIYPTPDLLYGDEWGTAQSIQYACAFLLLIASGVACVCVRCHNSRRRRYKKHNEQIEIQ